MKIQVFVITVSLLGSMAVGKETVHRVRRNWSYSCPQQTDFSASFRLSSDGTNYPAAAIDNERRNRIDGIDSCLERQTVPANATKVPEDPILLKFTRNTCPVSKQMLRSYFNTAINSTCWIILNVQEMINFASCTNMRCQYCELGSYWLQNLCFRQFEVFSVWSFCEELPVLSQIFRDRIIVPTTCICKQVQCKPRHRYFW